MTEAAVSIAKTEHTPALPADFAGIRIVAAPRPLRTSPLILHGAYRIPWPEADTIQPSRHRALCLVVTAGPRSFVATPFREQVLFEDDEQPTRLGPLGFFTMDVFSLQGHDHGGDYHVLVSLGAHVSNVIHVPIK